MEEQREHSLIDPVNRINSRTVQVLAFHPFNPTYTLWVHNLLESITTYIPRYGNTAKPPGWGFGGGGQEPDEIEKLRMRDPQHALLINKNISEVDRVIAACGLREFRDESGYHDISIRTVPRPRASEKEAQTTVRLYSHRLEDYWEDGSKTTHEIVTLWGDVESLTRRPIEEVDEVDKSEWLDVSMPLSRIFQNRAIMPGFPYWSHIRRTVIIIPQIDWWRRAFDKPEKCINHLVHPSWRLVFPIGKGDPRFPEKGFRIPPAHWYYLVEMMIQERIDMVGKNVILELFKEDIRRAVEREQEWEKKLYLPKAESADSVPDSEDIHDEYSGELTSEEFLRKQDEEYCLWMEKELGFLKDEDEEL